MKRPFAVIGFSYLATLFFLCYAHKYVAFAVIGISAIGLIISLIPKTPLHDKVLILCLLTILVASSQFTFLSLPKYEKVLKLDDKTETVVGEITDDLGSKYGKNYYALKITGLSHNNVNSNFKVRLSTNQTLKLESGDIIKAVVNFRKPPENYGFNSVKSNMSEGIFLYALPKGNIEITNKKFNPNLYAVRMRKSAQTIFDSNLSAENSSIMKALVLGNRDSLSDENYQNFKIAGVMHILVVSGMHISILMSFFLLLFKKLKIKPQIASLITIPIVLIFVALTGFSVSATRAGIMALIYLLSISLMKKSDSLNSLGISVFIMIVPNPFTVINLSFLLSVFATLGIITLGEKFMAFFSIDTEKRFLKKIADGISAILAQSFSANIAIFPIAVLALGCISVVFPITNVLMIPFSTLLLILGFLFLIVAPFKIPILTPILKFLIGLICKYDIFIAKVFGNEKFLMNLNNNLFKIFLACALILTGVYLLAKNKKKMIPLLAGLLSFLFIFTFVTDFITERKTTTLSVLDVDNGIATVVKTGGKSAVIGCGGNGLSYLCLKNKLEDLGIKEVDYFILPRNDYTFSSETENFLKTYKVRNMMLSHVGNKTDYSKISNLATEIFADEITLSEDVKITLCDKDKGSAVKLKICDMDVLITSNYIDFNEFDDDFRSADFIIASDYKNKKSDVACDTIILTSSKELYQKKKDRLLSEGFSLISTVDNKDIDFKFKDGNAYIID
jgi:competence protein ComEC